MELQSERPLLSILIPAYQYAEGVCRILGGIQPLSLGTCEVIVFDDSLDGEVEGAVAYWRGSTGMQVAYQRNRPPKGAAANWNALLDVARGEFCWLLHHDEFPIRTNFVEELIAVLRQNPEVDVLLLDCVLVDPASGWNRRHLPIWLRTLVVQRFPYYLFRRNVIGPTSSLVVRRALYPRFDVRLRWLIDVDAYVRLLRITKRLKLCPQIQIGSLLRRVDSITARLGSSIPQLGQEERAYLREVHPEDGFWLAPVASESVWNRLIRVSEIVGWNVMRVCTRIVALCCFGAVPRAVIKQAIHPQRTRAPSSAPAP